MVLVEFKPPCGLWEALNRLWFDYVFLNAVQLIDRLQSKKPKKYFEKSVENFHQIRNRTLATSQIIIKSSQAVTTSVTKLTRAKRLISIVWYSADLWERDDLSEKIIGLDHENLKDRNGPMIIRDPVILRTMLFGTVRYPNWSYEELK